jgi:simple sugar transport system permease protein
MATSGTAGAAAAPAPPASDERVREVSLVRRLLTRPELGAVGGAIIAWLFFAIDAGNEFVTWDATATYMEVAAQLAIIAVPVALLMIAGEFDLSVGSMVGAAGILIALPISEYGTPLWQSLLLALAAALLVGTLNGWITVRTGLPSFIVTLASLFIVRGLTLVQTRNITGRTQVSGFKQDAGAGGDFFIHVFGGRFHLFGTDWAVSILWAIGITLVATFVLLRTRFGNWIFGAGGDPEAARNVGVPVRRVKIILFICTALGATLLAAIQVLDAGSADVLRGTGKEFEAIAAAVIGGCLLTGGYGSAIGGFFGALLFGMVSQSIPLTGADSDWFQVFLGAMVLAAVLVNRFIRQQAQEL